MGIEAGESQTRPRKAEASAHVAIDHARGLDNKLGAQRVGRLGERDVNRDRHDGQHVRPDHHDRKGRRPPSLGELAEIFGVAGESEAGLIKHGLGDRIGHDCARLASVDRVDRASNQFDRRRSIGRAWAAGLGLDRMGERDDRQALSEYGCGRCRIGLDDRRFEPDAPGGGGEDGRRRQNEKRRA